MSRSLSSWQAMLLGIVVLLTLVLGGVALFTVGGKQNLFNGFVVHAHLDDAQRIGPGTRVFLHGMDAGEVETVDLTPNGQVAIRLRLAGKFRQHLTTGSKVQIVDDGFFGGKVVKLLPNRGTTQLVEAGAILTEEPGGDFVASLKKDIKQEIAQVTDDIKTSLGGDQLKETVGHLNRAVAKADILLDEVQKGKGTLGKLLTRNEIYFELLQALRDTQTMINSVKQNSDAIQALPLISSYVVDINKSLNRPTAKRHRVIHAESQLFEPGRAVLTEAGKRALDQTAEWLNKHKEDGSDVVVVAFADPRHPSGFANMLTQKQSRVVADYLMNTHNVHRMGWWWWSNRTVQALGCGTTPSPVPEKISLPAARVEIIVFVPEKQ